MQLKQKFVLRKIAGDNILVPLADKENSFDGILTLNETGVSIWKGIEQGNEKEKIVEDLLKEYDVDKVTVEKDIENLCKQLKELGIL